jgi:thiol-disulfide isomerase/thioredoxin
MSTTKSSSGRNAASSGRKAGPIIAVAGAAVLVAVLIAVFVGGSKDDPSAADGDGVAQVRPVQVIGTPLPEYDAADDTAIGARPPELAGQNFSGQNITIVPGGKAKLVVFVAHWCSHCQAEVPRLVEWMAAGKKPAELDVMAVSTAVNAAQGNYPPSAWLDREGFVVPTIADDAQGSARTAWGLPGYPYMVLLEADGTVAARSSGELGSVDAIDAWVKAGLGRG